MEKTEKFLESKEKAAWPSGKEAAKEQYQKKPRNKWLKRIGVGVAVISAAALVGCGPNKQEIQDMKASVPQAKQDSLTLVYDKEIAKNIDDARAETKKDTAFCIEEGMEKTWDKTKEDFKEKNAEYYVVRDHMLKRESEACITHAYAMPSASGGGFPVIHNEYKPEFENKLKASIKARETKIKQSNIATMKRKQNNIGRR